TTRRAKCEGFLETGPRDKASLGQEPPAIMIHGGQSKHPPPRQSLLAVPSGHLPHPCPHQQVPPPTKPNRTEEYRHSSQNKTRSHNLSPCDNRALSLCLENKKGRKQRKKKKKRKKKRKRKRKKKESS